MASHCFCVFRKAAIWRWKLPGGVVSKWVVGCHQLVRDHIVFVLCMLAIATSAIVAAHKSILVIVSVATVFLTTSRDTAVIITTRGRTFRGTVGSLKFGELLLNGGRGLRERTSLDPADRTASFRRGGADFGSNMATLWLYR